MPQVTYCVVQAFERTEKGHLRALAPKQASGTAGAIAEARRLAPKGGAIAFSRTGDTDTGEFADARILWQGGDVPSDFGQAA